jgi:hypothetical protein
VTEYCFRKQNSQNGQNLPPKKLRDNTSVTKGKYFATVKRVSLKLNFKRKKKKKSSSFTNCGYSLHTFMDDKAVKHPRPEFVKISAF